MEKTLKELWDERVILNKKIVKLDAEIANYKIEEAREKYGKDASCNNCRYYIVQDTEENGMKCGCKPAPCICCHNFCQYYQPDTDLTAWCKKHTVLLEKEEVESFQWLGLDIFSDNLSEKAKEIIKSIIEMNNIDE